MGVAIILFFGVYIVLILFFLYGWEASAGKLIPNTDLSRSVAVIVPIRNEALHLPFLIKSLSGIKYSPDKLEFIFVNDHSDDDSIAILSSVQLPNIKIINLTGDESGKKAALQKGIELSSAEIIVTTDADCKHHPNWLNSINAAFSQSNVNMVVGGVIISVNNSIFSKMQAIELVSLIGSGASLLQWKIPAMANGANLAFRRDLFFELKGYEGNEDIPSGDDEYLLRKFFNHNPAGVQFNNDPDSVVTTKPQNSLTKFFQQRIRWAGKWKHQTNRKIKWLAFLIFIFQCSFISTIVLYTIYGTPLLLILLLSKAILEAIFLFRVGQFLKVSLALIPFALLQIFYPIYVVITAIGSLFLSFEWKGRKY